MSQTKIFWSNDERAQVVRRAAILMLDHGYNYWGPTVVEAQKVLPRNRQRPESSILTQAKATLGEAIEAEIRALNTARVSAANTAKEKVEQPVPQIEEGPVEVLKKKGFAQAESLVGMAVESFTEEFKSLLRAALMSTVVEVIEEANGAMQDAMKNLPKGQFDIHAEVKTKEVSAISTAGKEVKADRIKVAIIGGTEKGSDKAIIEDGLGDVFDIRYIDAKGEAARAKTCDIILVRTAFTNHALTKTVEHLVGKDRMRHIHRSGPSAVNEWLMNHYASLPAQHA